MQEGRWVWLAWISTRGFESHSAHTTLPYNRCTLWRRVAIGTCRERKTCILDFQRQSQTNLWVEWMCGPPAGRLAWRLGAFPFLYAATAMHAPLGRTLKLAVCRLIAVLAGCSGMLSGMQEARCVHSHFLEQ